MSYLSSFTCFTWLSVGTSPVFVAVIKCEIRVRTHRRTVLSNSNLWHCLQDSCLYSATTTSTSVLFCSSITFPNPAYFRTVLLMLSKWLWSKIRVMDSCSFTPLSQLLTWLLADWFRSIPTFYCLVLYESFRKVLFKPSLTVSRTWGSYANLAPKRQRLKEV